MVHQVIIHVIGAQPVQLLAEIAVQRRTVADQILRQLGRNVNLVTDVVAFQDLPQGGLAAGIDVSGVIIIDSCPVGGQQLFFCFFNVDAASFSGKAHTPVAQDAQVVSVFVFSVLHMWSPVCIPVACLSVEQLILD